MTSAERLSILSVIGLSSIFHREVVMSMNDCDCGDCQDVCCDADNVPRTEDGRRIEPSYWVMTSGGPTAVGGVSIGDIVRSCAAKDASERTPDSVLCDMMDSLRKRCVEVVGDCPNSMTLRCSDYLNINGRPKFEWTFSYKRDGDYQFNVQNSGTIGDLIVLLRRIIKESRRMSLSPGYDVIAMGC